MGGEYSKIPDVKYHVQMIPFSCLADFTTTIAECSQLEKR